MDTADVRSPESARSLLPGEGSGLNTLDSQLTAPGHSPLITTLLGLRSSRALSRIRSMTIGQLILMSGALATMLITGLLSR
jgi:hypothetical protein